MMNTHPHPASPLSNRFSQPFFLEPGRNTYQSQASWEPGNLGNLPNHRQGCQPTSELDSDSVIGKKRIWPELKPSILPVAHLSGISGPLSTRTPLPTPRASFGHPCSECEAREVMLHTPSLPHIPSTNRPDSRILVPNQQHISSSVREEKLVEMDPTPEESDGDYSVPTSFDCSHKLDKLLADREESDKAILKVVLFEVIINEKVNKHRISFLPNQVVEVLSLFLRRHYGFCLENASREGSSQKYLFPIRASGGEYDREDALILESFRFRFQLYFQGVKKKLPKNNTKLTEDYYVTKTLFEKVFSNHNLAQDTRSNKLTLFWSLVQMTFNKESPLTVETIKACLPRPLMIKLQSLGEGVLKKYYVIKLKQYLNELFAGQKTSVAQIKQRLKVSEKFHLFSDLMQDPGLKLALERRNYQIGPSLDLD